MNKKKNHNKNHKNTECPPWSHCSRGPPLGARRGRNIEADVGTHAGAGGPWESEGGAKESGSRGEEVGPRLGKLFLNFKNSLFNVLNNL